MIHKPIQIKNLELSFPHKICFENFTTQLNYGSRIAIIGRNGSGKSTLLKILLGTFEATGGSIRLPEDVVVGYVPQLIEEFSSLSGAQRLNEAITRALSLDPNMLLLDEPTNHLDKSNRESLMRMLQSYPGTLIVVSHDTELLRNYIDNLWHIDNSKICVFSGNYDDYMREMHKHRASIEQELSRLDRQKKEVHEKLMQEQKRATKSRAKGEKNIDQRKWPLIVSKSKALRAEETSGRKKSAIDQRKHELTKQLSDLRLPEIIVPRFSIGVASIGNRMIIQVNGGSVGYRRDKPILQNINFSVFAKDRIAILGDNGSGKSTLLKVIVGNPTIFKEGEWLVPKREDIGYLDQHYGTLDPTRTVLESISNLVPHWSHAEVRRLLNEFLFRKNEEVNSLVSTLSGGEKVRLSLAQIAAKTPKILILDEITNNLDLETKEHVINVLKSYPGTMIVISHDADFLKEIGINASYDLRT